MLAALFVSVIPAFLAFFLGMLLVSFGSMRAEKREGINSLIPWAFPIKWLRIEFSEQEMPLIAYAISLLVGGLLGFLALMALAMRGVT